MERTQKMLQTIKTQFHGNHFTSDSSAIGNAFIHSNHIRRTFFHPRSHIAILILTANQAVTRKQMRGRMQDLGAGPLSVVTYP